MHSGNESTHRTPFLQLEYLINIHPGRSHSYLYLERNHYN